MPFAERIVSVHYFADRNETVLSKIIEYFKRDCAQCGGVFEYKSKEDILNDEKKCLQLRNDFDNLTDVFKCWVTIDGIGKWIYSDENDFNKFVYSKWSCTEIRSSNPACKRKNI